VSLLFLFRRGCNKTHVFVFVGVLQQCCNVYCYGIIIIEYMSHNVCLLSHTHTYMHIPFRKTMQLRIYEL